MLRDLGVDKLPPVGFQCRQRATIVHAHEARVPGHIEPTAASRRWSRAKRPSPERSPYRDIEHAPIAQCTTGRAREISWPAPWATTASMRLATIAANVLNIRVLPPQTRSPAISSQGLIHVCHNDFTSRLG